MRTENLADIFATILDYAVEHSEQLPNDRLKVLSYLGIGEKFIVELKNENGKEFYIEAEVRLYNEQRRRGKC